MAFSLGENRRKSWIPQVWIEAIEYYDSQPCSIWAGPLPLQLPPMTRSLLSAILMHVELS